MSKPMRFRDFKRKMQKLGIIVKQASKATHFKLSRESGGTTLIYIVARDGSEIRGCYIDGAKRALEISDREFDEA